MDAFTITLISNSEKSKALYPENTVACFKTQLFQPLELDGPHEAGVKEFIVPTSFFNITPGDYRIWLPEDEKYKLEEIAAVASAVAAAAANAASAAAKKSKTKTVVENPNEYRYKTDSGSQITIFKTGLTPVVFKDFVFPAGNYSDVASFIEVINAALNGILTIEYSPGSGHIKVVNPNSVKIEFSRKLRAVLGLPDEEHSGPVLSCESKIPVNLFRNVPQQLSIYTNIIEPTKFGDGASKVLRVVGLPDVTQYGKLAICQYDNPDYVRVQQNYIHNIEIEIRTLIEDKPAPFIYGPSIVKLEFRKVRGRQY